jgi:hypothetical protein
MFGYEVVSETENSKTENSRLFLQFSVYGVASGLVCSSNLQPTAQTTKLKNSHQQIFPKKKTGHAQKRNQFNEQKN